jgi:hypothetical protein
VHIDQAKVDFMLLFFIFYFFVLWSPPLMLGVSGQDWGSLVPLTKDAYTYYADILMDSTIYRMIIDTSTANLAMVVDENTFSAITNASTKNCISLSVDTTAANFTHGSQLHSCYILEKKISLVQNTGYMNSSFSALMATKVAAENDILHQWAQYGSGILGMAYHTAGVSEENGYASYFRSILGNTSMFALDLNPRQSSLELGGASNPSYGALQWYQNTNEAPQVHQFMMANLSMCGTLLYSNWSSSWPAIVDSSASCLTLPAEFYTVFDTWLNVSHVTDENIDALPPIMFSVSGSDTQLYIRLSDLVVDANAIRDELGAPTLASGKRICVLQHGEIYLGNGYYSRPVPSITIGNLALQSLYFAANFDNNSVAFASKGSVPSDDLIEAVGTCSVTPQCIGLQGYHRWTNVCLQADCKSYFFMDRDEETQECVWRNGAFGVGLFTVLMVILIEIFVYFVSLYTGHKMTQQPLHPVFEYIGEKLTAVADYIVHKLEWIEPLPPDDEGIEDQ